MAKQIGTITKLDGNVEIIKPNGSSHRAAVGDIIYEGDKIITSANASVQILEDNGTPLDISANQTVLLDNSVFGTDLPTAIDSAITPATSDTIIQALDRGQDLSTSLDATAAGLGGGDGGGGSTFVQLGRILEGVIGNQYAYRYEGLGIPPLTEGVGQVQSTQTVASNTPTLPEVPHTDPQPPVVPPVVPPVPPEPPVVPPVPPVVPPEPPVVPPVPPVVPPEPPVVPPVPPVVPPVPPVTPPDDGGDKEHKDNGKGNGVDPAPGNSGNTPGDNADGSNTPGTTDNPPPGNDDHHPTPDPTPNPTPDPTPNPPPVVPPVDDTKHDNNGGGNGVDNAPGNSGNTKGDDADGSNTPGTPDTSGNGNNNTDHANNGGGNGVDPAPGNSGSTPGDNADGSDTPGTPDTTGNGNNSGGNSDNTGANNGWGNGDQTAPGNSADNNNAENNTSGKTDPSNSPNNTLNINDLLSDGKHELVFEEVKVGNGNSAKTTTTVHIEDSTTHADVKDLVFSSHVDHTVQSIIDELAKHNGNVV